MPSLREALFAYHRRAVHLPRVQRVAAALSALGGEAGSVLDVGAGDGRIAERVGRAVGATRVEGVDIGVRPGAVVPVRAYDGKRLPYGDGEVELVLLSDVLHHAEDPGALLAECLRVASRAVVVKDHFQSGPVSDALLLAMDLVGNAEAGVLVRGRYFTQASFDALVRAAGARVAARTWPLRIHDLPFRLVTRDELQFCARVERRRESDT